MYHHLNTLIRRIQSHHLALDHTVVIRTSIIWTPVIRMLDYPDKSQYYIIIRLNI